MTAFDFISTIASGSLLASASKAQTWTTFFQPSIGIFANLGFNIYWRFFASIVILLMGNSLQMIPVSV